MYYFFFILLDFPFKIANDLVKLTFQNTSFFFSHFKIFFGYSVEDTGLGILFQLYKIRTVRKFSFYEQQTKMRCF